MVLGLMPGSGQQAFQRGAGIGVVPNEKQFRFQFFYPLKSFAICQSANKPVIVWLQFLRTGWKIFGRSSFRNRIRRLWPRGEDLMEGRWQQRPDAAAPERIALLRLRTGGGPSEGQAGSASKMDLLNGRFLNKLKWPSRCRCRPLKKRRWAQRPVGGRNGDKKNVKMHRRPDCLYRSITIKEKMPWK
jgi:hypothetical protein